MIRCKSFVVTDSVSSYRWQWHLAWSLTEKAVFPFQQWLRGDTTMLGFNYTVYILQIKELQSLGHSCQSLYDWPNTVNCVNLVTFLSWYRVTVCHTLSNNKFLYSNIYDHYFITRSSVVNLNLGHGFKFSTMLYIKVGRSKDLLCQGVYGPNSCSLAELFVAHSKPILSLQVR